MKSTVTAEVKLGPILKDELNVNREHIQRLLENLVTIAAIRLVHPQKLIDAVEEALT